MVQDKGSPLHVGWHTFPKDLVHVSTQVRKGQGSLGNAVLIAIRVASKQDIIIWAVLVSTRPTCVSEGVGQEVPEGIQIVSLGLLTQVSGLVL